MLRRRRNLSKVMDEEQETTIEPDNCPTLVHHSTSFFGCQSCFMKLLVEGLDKRYPILTTILNDARDMKSIDTLVDGFSLYNITLLFGRCQIGNVLVLILKDVQSDGQETYFVHILESDEALNLWKVTDRVFHFPDFYYKFKTIPKNFYSIDTNRSRYWITGKSKNGKLQCC